MNLKSYTSDNTKLKKHKRRHIKSDKKEMKTKFFILLNLCKN